MREEGRIGKVVEVQVRDLSHNGEAVCPIENQICFVPGLLPSEVALIEITEEKAKFSRGKIVKLINASPHRREVLCPYQGDCGGCPIMPLEDKAQFQWKKSSTEKNMEKIAGIRLHFDDLLPADKCLGYRNKVTLFYKEGELAMRKANSHELVPIENCLLAEEELKLFFPLLKGQKHYDSVVLRSSDEGVMVIVHGEKLKENPPFYDGLINQGAASIYFCKQKRNLPALSGKLIHLRGKKHLVYKVMERNFSLTPRSFFQINRAQMERLYKLVLDYAELDKENRVLDLYSGQGTLGAYLAGHCKEVIGIEVVGEAVKTGTKHLPKNMTLLQGKVEDYSKNLPQVDVVIVDPPRAGLHQSVVNPLLKMEPERIVYVACNPATQARDLKMLGGKYKMKRAGLCDLFPNTYHVETVVLMSRAGK